ncbi:hypothetical protein [Nostoc sp. 'Peltigera malacea cyanobiont' DB3992]|uniref:hypothetical protein n=1 Tax=Nostoc sp. 'Peltigera malacea cyanobiont' DB3992 TaxID=1206980 RepID=UPI000C043848|nr:hypothetical protein [Nostoc sp. 'Peltigera malacea cyanobiont' DB3992]PHM05633.1 hypothetical protein CK516_39795 [Nostoc sp. 'Peltigera malacea cyanobiont' DB3992]
MVNLESLIVAKNVHISYSEGKNKFTAVEDVSFAVKPGESLYYWVIGLWKEYAVKGDRWFSVYQ